MNSAGGFGEVGRALGTPLLFQKPGPIKGNYEFNVSPLDNLAAKPVILAPKKFLLLSIIRHFHIFRARLSPTEAHSLDVERSLLRQKEVVTLVPEIILDQAVACSRKVRQLISSTPLWPVRQSGCAFIRVHRIEEADVVILDACAREVWSDTISCQDVRGVECAEDWGAIIIGREVRPSRDIGEDRSSNIEEHTSS